MLGGKNIQDKLWQSRQVRAVLKALVARRGVVTTSEQLIEMLWPEDDPETACRRLYVRVSQLRKLLKSYQGFNPIRRVPGGYVFNTHVPDADYVQEDQIDGFIWVDVDDFERAADQGSLFLDHKQLDNAVAAFERARQLHRGDYLAEDLYAEWTIAERERLNERYLVVLTELAEAYAQQGYFRRSINLCQQILCLDPWREAVFVHLMLYYYYAGDKAKALQTYDQCQRALKVDVGIDPDPHTTWLAQCIREGNLWSQPGAAAYPPPAYEGRMFEVPYSLGEPPFIGRDRELAWLLDHWRRDPQGCTWISGDAGIGKTRLANAFMHVIQAEGAEVIKLTASNAPGGFYEALLNALNISDALSTITELSPQNRTILSKLANDDLNLQTGADLRDIDRSDGKKISAAVLELISAKFTHLLICVDDAHLMDEASMEVFQDMIGRVGLLMTSRLGETLPGHPFLQLTQHAKPFIRARRLKPWDLDDVRDLLHNLGGENILNIVDDLYTRSQGNPLFIIASLQHLFEEGLLYVTPDGRWAQSGLFEGAIAPSIEKAIAQRLNLVQQEDRRILDVLAVAGGAADYEILQAVLDRDESALLTSVDQLISKALILEPRDYRSADLTLAHGLYAEVLYETLPKARQRIFHRRIAEAMLSTGRNTSGHASSVADHFYRGGALMQASHYARLAGEHALRLYSPGEALLHYQNALNWVEELVFDEKQPFMAQVWLGMAEAERFLGNYQQASEHYQHALPFLQGAYKEGAVFQMFNIQLLQGKPLSVYDEAAKGYEMLLEAEGDSWALALLYWSKSFIALMRGDAKQTRLQQVEGWRVARHLCAQDQQPPPWILQRAYSILMRAHNQWGNYGTSIHFAQRVLSVDSRTEMNPNTQAVVSASLGDSLHLLREICTG
jgi:DNA-binding SARP family transcriptional activator